LSPKKVTVAKAIHNHHILIFEIIYLKESTTKDSASSQPIEVGFNRCKNSTDIYG
jgi:hypothetical protein